jgi:protease I
MRPDALRGKRVAILVADGFEQSELLEPRRALDDAGATTEVISPSEGKVRGWNHKDWGNQIPFDISLRAARAEDFHALLLPGGVINADRLRTIPKAVDFVRHFTQAGKPVAAICHAPWILIEAGAVRGHTLTSWPSLKTDLTNAGANWIDQEVVLDGQFVTSRWPDDIPAFNREMISLFAQEQGKEQHEERHAQPHPAANEPASERKIA